MEQVDDSISIAMIQSELIPVIDEVFSELFQMIPIPPSIALRVEPLVCRCYGCHVWVDILHFVEFKWPESVFTDDNNVMVGRDVHCREDHLKDLCSSMQQSLNYVWQYGQ